MWFDGQKDLGSNPRNFTAHFWSDTSSHWILKSTPGINRVGSKVSFVKKKKKTTTSSVTQRHWWHGREWSSLAVEPSCSSLCVAQLSLSYFVYLSSGMLTYRVWTLILPQSTIKTKQINTREMEPLGSAQDTVNRPCCRQLPCLFTVGFL